VKLVRNSEKLGRKEEEAETPDTLLLHSSFLLHPLEEHNL
jgi:hypothetical protein